MSKRVRVFLSAGALIKWMAQTFPAGHDERTDIQRTLWAVCLQEARVVSNAYTTKDIASMFLDGVPSRAADPIVSIQDWLDSIYADLNPSTDLRLESEQWITKEEAEEADIMDVVAAITADFGGGRQP